MDRIKEKEQKTAKNIAGDWASDNTFHGLPKILKSNKIGFKIYWLFWFLLAVGLLIGLIISPIKDFLKREVMVTTTYIYDVPVSFPAVRLCNLNIWNFKRASQFITNGLNIICSLNILNMQSSLQPNQTAFNLMQTFLNSLKIWAYNPSMQSYNRTSNGFLIDEILVSCLFLGQTCSASDFTLSYDYNYGNCYTFNGNRYMAKTVANAGPAYGLQLELFTGDPSIETFTYERGFYVVVHNQSVTPIMDSEGLTINNINFINSINQF